jgi:rubrerythrin
MSTHHLAEPELAAIKLEGGLTRSAFLVRGTLAAGAVYGMSAVSPFVSRSLAQSGGGDIDVVNYALTLEYLEAAFYQQAAKQVPGLSGDLKKLVKELGENEQEHVDALVATAKKLGGTPVKKPGVDFGSAFSDKATFLKVANVFEDTGVSAYNGAAPMIQAAEVLAAAGGIVQVEARHAALIRLERGKPPAPQAFDKASDMATVVKAVTPYLKA